MDGITNNSANQNSVNALLLLFIFDKMDIPVTESTLIEMACSINDWISYMDYKQALSTLISKKWITTFNTGSTEISYTLTVDGRVCLSHLYFEIPSSKRAAVAEYVNTNRMRYRRKQEYVANYTPNADGTYTVNLSIMDTNTVIIEMTLRVENRQTANLIYKRWEEKAADVYALLYDHLVTD